ncbi:MBOAT family O-acyltransferase [Magnetovibrio sp. PR-2]|uniref:MBOAT family O-acyltransferase n=1 Tax=Magnetovibrio sp. PR-2 TaxID=3120356 RepID=UPI002FCDF5C5
MVFSSYTFTLFFLPAVLMLTYFFRKKSSDAVIVFLILASIVYYGFWNWQLVWIIFLSIGVNFSLGLLLDRYTAMARVRLAVLVSGVVFNLGLLGFYKYSNFFIENFNVLLGGDVGFLSVVLPLGISFFTFQQIAYLVDVFQNKVHEHKFHHYFLFVTFFPQLIAGPIVHHKEIMPQIVGGALGRFSSSQFAQGLSIFVLGLSKKVILADGIAVYATPVFEAAESGIAIPLLEAWGGVLAYTFQIYFDFSGYSDMAIGLGLMLGLKLPINFLSPYKASSLIEFWNRWHITLSRFLKDYLYIPLGGNRKGEPRQYMNILVVMLLGGFWHGASWNFVIWGGLHGVGLTVNHYYRSLKGETSEQLKKSWVQVWLGRIVTFLFVVFAWVFFRATSFDGAMNIVQGMVGLNGIVLPVTYSAYLGSYADLAVQLGVEFKEGYLYAGSRQVLMLVALLGVAWFLPSTLEWTAYESPLITQRTHALMRHTKRLRWSATPVWGGALSCMCIVCLIYMSHGGEFLYFQF